MTSMELTFSIIVVLDSSLARSEHLREVFLTVGIIFKHKNVLILPFINDFTIDPNFRKDIELVNSKMQW